MARILVCGTNWLGDSVMSLPALAAHRAAAPADELILAVKPGLAPFWDLYPSLYTARLALSPGLAGLLRAARELRARAPDRAVLLPNSLRSALLPWLAGVPERAGARGHWRRALLTRVLETAPAGARRHQAWEAMRLLGLDDTAAALPPLPPLTPPREAAEQAAALLPGAPGTWLAVLPGAARGPSKQWPAAHFAAAARALCAARGWRPVLFGAPGDRAACDAVAAALPGALNLGGRTSLPVLAAALQRAGAALSNDSGGMHLAAAAGIPVVAVFGLTDPAVTGPLGARCRAVTAPGGPARSRDIARRSATAAAVLAAIEPDTVIAAARELLPTP